VLNFPTTQAQKSTVQKNKIKMKRQLAVLGSFPLLGDTIVSTVKNILNLISKMNLNAVKHICFLLSMVKIYALFSYLFDFVI
jgi:hypothetical protein